MKKVYIVDDDRDIVESLTIVLETEGYEVGSQLVEDGVVENTAAFGPDIIILDVMFPENQSAGFDMARLLHKDETTKDIPVIMLSAINEKGSYAGTFSNKDRDESYLPVTDFVEKPIRPADLIAKIKSMTE